MKKGILRILAKLKGKRLCRNFFLIKLQASEKSLTTLFYRTPLGD